MYNSGKKFICSILIFFLSLLISTSFIPVLVNATGFSGAVISTDRSNQTDNTSKDPTEDPIAYLATNNAGYSLNFLENIQFTEDNSVFQNPERGWYRAYSSGSIWGLDALIELGISIIQVNADLGKFLDKPISKSKLAEIRSSFISARNRGLQVIFRAAYDFTGISKCEPKSLDIIKGHISQLKSIFYANEDVLYCVQAGFLGPWGEWHSSYYGDTPSLEARKAVLFALMDAVPVSRSIQVRRPMFVRDIFAEEQGGNVITENTAFNGSMLSRTGYHDDALLSTDNEYGTYVDPGYDREKELEWTDNHNKYTPFGGESCYLGENSDADNAIAELSKLHAQFINIDYDPKVIEKWKNTQYQDENTFQTISEKLGYRFVIDNIKINFMVIKGGVLHIILDVRNEGFGNLINERDLQLILSNGKYTYTATINDDPRKWYNENGNMIKDMYFSIPSNIAEGTWNVYLNMPSKSANLRNNGAYSVRFANKDIWNKKTGYNLIKKNLVIKGSNIGKSTLVFKQISRNDSEIILNGKNDSNQNSQMLPMIFN